MVDRFEFDRLADEWDHTTMHLSNLRTILDHPACRKIIAMGDEAIPWCLERLRGNSRLAWSMLLRELTGEDPGPAPERIKGSLFAYNVKAIANRWLAWGQEKGFIS